MSEEASKAVRTALLIVSVAIIAYFTLSVIRRGAPHVGSVAGDIQDTVK